MPSDMKVYTRKRKKPRQSHVREDDAITSPPLNWDCDPLDLSRFALKYSRRRRVRLDSRECSGVFSLSKKAKVKVKVKVKVMARNGLIHGVIPAKMKVMARNRWLRAVPPDLHCHDGKQCIADPTDQDVKRKKRGYSRVVRVRVDRESISFCNNFHKDENRHELEDGDKQQWWNGERKKSLELIDFFMDHIRSIQGDRQFVPWKCSVMDSIVGAMLSQNVSDILSSSAFMELASRFTCKEQKKGDGSPHELVNKSVKCTMESKKIEKEDVGENMEKDDGGKKAGHLLDWREFKRECLSKITDVPGLLSIQSVESIVDWKSVAEADVNVISQAIELRGQNNRMAQRIKNLLIRSMEELGSTDIEWIRIIHPNEMRKFLLSIYGLGSKSIDCIILLTLHQKAFPVDRNVARICVRLGWVQIQSPQYVNQIHIKKLDPDVKDIQVHLWPRLCKLDLHTLYELHYQLITFGKVFCTKSKPNCSACPMKVHCDYYASDCARTTVALSGLKDIEDTFTTTMIVVRRMQIVNCQSW